MSAPGLSWTTPGNPHPGRRSGRAWLADPRCHAGDRRGALTHSLPRIAETPETVVRGQAGYSVVPANPDLGSRLEVPFPASRPAWPAPVPSPRLPRASRGRLTTARYPRALSPTANASRHRSLQSATERRRRRSRGRYTAAYRHPARRRRRSAGSSRSRPVQHRLSAPRGRRPSRNDRRARSFAPVPSAGCSCGAGDCNGLNQRNRPLRSTGRFHTYAVSRPPPHPPSARSPASPHIGRSHESLDHSVNCVSRKM